MPQKGKKRKAAPGDIATNRQASYRYHLLDRWEAGMILQGSEVKSLREGGVQIKDAYAALEQGEVWLHNMHIAPYKPAARENHEPERPRKLLLHAFEIERLIGKTQERGLTLVPTRVYFKGPNAKVEIALARGKDVGDKRRALKDRDQQREIDRALAERQ
jgi:SsrA-binding protein